MWIVKKALSVFAPLLMLATSVFAQTNQTIPFLTLADIHFDPFISCKNQVPCPLILELQQAPVSKWHAILSAHEVSMSQFRQDTNDVLLSSALAAAKQAAEANHPQFVMVLGDFLGHDYRQLFKKYTQNRNRADYRTFVQKTLLFMSNELSSAFGTTSVYALIGNNDTYGGDYKVDVHGAFFRDTGEIWSGLIKDKQQGSAMRREFTTGGYYAVDAAPNLRLVVLNSVLFATKAKGKDIDAAADTQLKWLHSQLEAAKGKHQQVIIAMHIPVGIDVYASLKYRLFRLVEFWRPAYVERFENELRDYSTVVSGIFTGHIHADWFQVLALGNERKIPVTGTPSISPIFGNNPGFKIYTYSPKEEQIDNFKTYYYPLRDNGKWGLEYSFNHIYQPHCVRCPVITGMEKLTPSNQLAAHYKHFYAVSTTSQPITTKWNPYYWCAIHEVKANDYARCIT